MQCCPIILLELCPLSLKGFSVDLWTRVSMLRLTELSVSRAPQKPITHEPNDWKNGKQLPCKHMQDVVFCSSKEMSFLCQTHCWAEKGGSAWHPEGQQPHWSGWGLPRRAAKKSSLKAKWERKCAPSPLWELWACASRPLLPCQLPPVPDRWQQGQEAQLGSCAVDWSPKATAWGLHEIGAAETVAQPRVCMCVSVCVCVCVCARVRVHFSHCVLWTFPRALHRWYRGQGRVVERWKSTIQM